VASYEPLRRVRPELDASRAITVGVSLARRVREAIQDAVVGAAVRRVSGGLEGARGEGAKGAGGEQGWPALRGS
jgi:hypothetical protein